MERKRAKGGGRMQCFMKKEDKSLYHTNVFEADNIYHNPPPNVISPICFAIFISLCLLLKPTARILGPPDSE